MKIETVDKCGNCPFFYQDMEMQVMCQAKEHSFEDKESELYGDIAPSYCPLRKGPIMVQLEGDNPILSNRAKSCGITIDDYIAFCIDRTLRTTVDDLQIELQQFKEKIK